MMTPELLTHIIENFAYQYALRHGREDRDVLVVLLNYGAFKDVAAELRALVSLTQRNPPPEEPRTPMPGAFIYQTRPDFFIFRGVRVSWSPLVEEPDKYIFGVTEPAALP